MSETPIDQHEWYERLARRTGGYRKTWRSELLGNSGEAAFTELLFGRLDQQMRILDAGCGSGEFTLEVVSGGAGDRNRLSPRT